MKAENDLFISYSQSRATSFNLSPLNPWTVQLHLTVYFIFNGCGDGGFNGYATLPKIIPRAAKHENIKNIFPIATVAAGQKYKTMW